MLTVSQRPRRSRITRRGWPHGACGESHLKASAPELHLQPAHRHDRADKRSPAGASRRRSESSARPSSMLRISVLVVERGECVVMASVEADPKACLRQLCHVSSRQSGVRGSGPASNKQLFRELPALLGFRASTARPSARMSSCSRSGVGSSVGNRRASSSGVGQHQLPGQCAPTRYLRHCPGSPLPGRTLPGRSGRRRIGMAKSTCCGRSSSNVRHTGNRSPRRRAATAPKKSSGRTIWWCLRRYWSWRMNRLCSIGARAPSLGRPGGCRPRGRATPPQPFDESTEGPRPRAGRRAFRRFSPAVFASEKALGAR